MLHLVMGLYTVACNQCMKQPDSICLQISDSVDLLLNECCVISYEHTCSSTFSFIAAGKSHIVMACQQARVNLIGQ